MTHMTLAIDRDNLPFRDLRGVTRSQVGPAGGCPARSQGSQLEERGCFAIVPPLPTCLKERWPSGRRRTPGTRVGGQPSRGFESLPLRSTTLVSQGIAGDFQNQPTSKTT